MPRPSSSVLARPFVLGALAYLLLGAWLGLAMVVHPALTAGWRSVHAHIVVNGSVSFLLYAATYWTLPLAFGRCPPAHLAPAVGGHLWTAHAAVAGLVLGRALGVSWMSALGGLAQMGSVLLFAWVVFLTAASPVASPHAQDHLAGRFIGLGVIALVAGGVAGGALGGPLGFSPRFVAATVWFLVVGFVLATAAGIGYLLVPRLWGRPVRSLTAARWHLWGLAIAAPVLGVAYFTGARQAAGAAHLVVAVALAAFAWTLWPALAGDRAPAASRRFIRLALGFGIAGAVLAAATALGLGRPLPRPPLLHLHLVGLVTLAAFGLVYALLHGEGRMPDEARWPSVHLWLAGPGLAGMVAGFAGVRLLLVAGAVLQFAGVVGFAVALRRYLVRSGSQP